MSQFCTHKTQEKFLLQMRLAVCIASVGARNLSNTGINVVGPFLT